MTEFTENADGVHLMSPIHSEYSLCGDAWDLNVLDDMGDDMQMRPTRKRTVTCADCIRIIQACRGVRTKQAHGPG